MDKGKYFILVFLILIDYYVDPSVPSASISIPLVAFETGGSAPNKSFYPSRSLGLVKQTF